MTSEVRSELIAAEDAGRWRAVLERCDRYDVYHTPEYHSIAERVEHGRAHLLVVERDAGVCALPFLIRDIRGYPWLAGTETVDATSVYGYTGPVSNAKDRDGSLATLFQEELLGTLRGLGVVSLFCRLHPLMEQAWLFEGMGSVSRVGSTAGIPLETANSIEDFVSVMSTNHRRDIRKLIKSGVTVEEDTEFSRLGDFVAAYGETMRRNQASEWYYFGREYFERLVDLLHDNVHLFLARSSSGELLSMLIAFSCNDIIQYHLGATPDRFRKSSAVKLIFAELATWGAHRNYRYLHLGGGVGAADSDPLFRFKRGFSNDIRPFEVFGLVVRPDVHAELCGRRRAALGLSPDSAAADYFPEYRAPAA